MIDYEGSCELDGMGVRGWARSRDVNSFPLWVELLVDDIVMGISLADLRDPQECGFWIPIPSQALENGTTARVRVANTDCYIGEPLMLAAALSESTLQGECYADRGLTLSGWAVDSLNPDQVVRLTALVDDAVAAETLANQPRYRPEQGQGHGFVMNLPMHFADGLKHKVVIQDSRKRNLRGCPIYICLRPESLADWVEATPHPSAKERSLLVGILRRMEARLSGPVKTMLHGKQRFRFLNHREISAVHSRSHSL